MDSELSRKILSWYARFDLFAGFMSGYETVLGREWFAANEQYYAEQEAQHPDSIFCRIEAAVAKHRILAMDMALLFAKLSRGAISMPDFGKENEMLAARISGWKKSLEPLLSDDRYLVESFEGAPARAQDDIVDPYRPGGLRQGPLWALNFLMVDGLSTTIMHTYQTALIMQRKDTPDGLEKMALETCRLFEAVEYWPGSPSGSILSAQAGLGIAVIFLPQDERHIMWCRRKLAKIEAQGSVVTSYLFYWSLRCTSGSQLPLGILTLQHFEPRWPICGKLTGCTIGGCRTRRDTPRLCEVFVPSSKIEVRIRGSSRQ